MASWNQVGIQTEFKKSDVKWRAFWIKQNPLLPTSSSTWPITRHFLTQISSCSLFHHLQGPWIGSSLRCTISASELSPLPLSQSWVMMWQHVIGRLMSNVSCNIHFPLKWTKKSISHLETPSRSYTSRVIVQNWMGLKFKVAVKSFSFDCSSGHAALWEAEAAGYWWELGMSFGTSLTPPRSPFLLWQDAPETSREESWAWEVGRSGLQGWPCHFFLCEPQFPHLWNRVHKMDFPGGSVVRTPRFHCRGHRFNSWSGNWDPACCAVQ